MFEYKPYINTASGVPGISRISVKEEKYDDGVTGVFVKALCRDIGDPGCVDNSIHSEKGICIDIIPENAVKSYMANYRHNEFWCSPYFGKSFEEMPSETQNLVAGLENGSFVCVVPVVNGTYKCVLEGCKENTFTARMFSWYDNMYQCEGLAFVYAIAKRPMEAMEKCVKRALEILGTGVRYRTQRRYPEIFDYLGWCSWDSMQIRVSEEGLLSKCEEFRNKDIPVKWAIIDDMWAEIRDFYGEDYQDFSEMVQLMHCSSMYHFEADPKRFPNGLKYCVSKIKEYGINVGMWHPTTGYWRGYDAEGTAYHILKDYLIEAPNGYIVPDWKEEKSYMYYRTLHNFFKRCGADFVKVDNQSMARRYYKNLAPVGKVARSFHNGMEASVGEIFDNQMINCMGMASEDMWNRTVSPISRCSDDFMPENREWFTKHILQCAYNSILQGQFYWCDWDMWWTDDGQAGKNSLMRAISGGPVYVSDKIGRSKKELLQPLMLSDGKILRCDKPCTPTYDCITEDPTTGNKAIKLQNTVGEYGIMAVLNINKNEKAVKAEISGKYIDGFTADEYAVYEHYSKELKKLKGDESFEITLSDADDYRLYIFAPIKNGFAAIGRTDKLISPKTIKYVHREEIVLIEDGPYAYVRDGKLCFS